MRIYEILFFILCLYLVYIYCIYVVNFRSFVRS